MARDKILHFVAGVVVAVVMMILTQDLRIAVGSSVVIGLIKEIYDSMNRERHTPEFLDFAATSAGGFLVGVMFKIWEGL